MPELVCSADDPRWLEERRRGVTATDITVIAGLSPYDSAYSLFFKKRGDIPDIRVDNDRLRLGHDLEPIIISRWLDARNIPQPHRERAYSALYRSSERPWQLATPDRMYYDEPLEVKSWADQDRDAWADGPPPRIRAQVLWQMDVMDSAVGHVGVLFLPSGEFRSYVIEHCSCVKCRNEPGGCSSCSACCDTLLLREAGRDFMDRLDLNEPPSPDASSATLAALKARFTDIHHDKQAEVNEVDWGYYIETCDEIKDLEETKRTLESMIREQAGEARTLTVNGVKVATRIISDSHVKAHDRHSDYIRRAAAKGDADGQ